MKKRCAALLCLFLCCFLPGLFAGCNTDGGGNKPSGTIKIGISVYDQYDTFVSLLSEQFDEYVRAKEQETGLTITVLLESAGGRQVTQNSQVESFIRDGCDVICVNLVDRTDASNIIDKAEAADIPVVFFNRELVEEDLERWDKLYYVGARALESGIIQGEIVAELCDIDLNAVDRNGDGKLQYVMLEGEAGHQDAVVRTEYSTRTTVEKGYVLERLEDDIANWNRAQAQTKMTQWLQTHPDSIEVVYANNDDMALGAIDALKVIQPDYWPVIVGIDGTPVGLEAVLRGEMAGTALNDANGQAKGLLELCYHLATGEPLSKDITLEGGKYIRYPYRKVTPENISTYISFYE